jgi:hypothetical protein
VAVESDLLVVGDPGRGKVLTYVRLDQSWIVATTLTPPYDVALGQAVSLEAGRLLAGGSFVVFGPPGFAAVYEMGQCIPGAPFCAGTGCPCGNDDATAGCVSSRDSGALLIGSGSASVTAASLGLTATNCPANNSALFFAGDLAISPGVFVGDGLSCVGGASFRYPAGVVSSTGTFTLADPFGAAPAGFIAPGVTRHFQAWTRDVLCGPPPSPCPSPCGKNSNLTNAYSVTFEP